MTRPVAIVTGASRGIGAAIARRLGQNHSLILLARNAQALESVADELKQAGGEADSIACDLTDWGSVQQAFRRIGDHAAPSVLVNNAGIGGPFHRIDEVDDAEWTRIFHTNVRSLFWLCREYLPVMKERKFGRIVNISSVLGVVGGGRSSTYVATKHAIVGYTKALACEWGSFGITCNAICPGFVDRAMHGESRLNAPLRNIPSGRLGTPEEIAALVEFLCSREAAYINGAALLADGGLTAGSWTELSDS
jgi:3-oxoacyl-[acyl-carrier protein] reductase